MKKIIYLMVIVLSFSIIAPSVSFASKTDVVDFKFNDLVVNDKDFKLIMDTDEKIIFQLKEKNGDVYEYVEIVTKLDNGNELLTQEKYLINSNGIKELITSEESIIEEVLLNSIISTIQDDKLNLVIDSSSISPLSSSSSGGSKIAAVYWDEYKDGMAHATSGTYSKYVKKDLSEYLEFKYLTNELSSLERGLATLGVLGVVDAVIAAVRGGEALSLTLIKKVSGKLLAAVPGLGTLYQIYNYVTIYIDARKAHDKIPSKY